MIDSLQLSSDPLAHIPTTWDWPRFWSWANRRLRDAGYRHSTRRFYRQVLRSFHGFCRKQRETVTTQFPFAYPLDAPSAPAPREITPDDIHAYLNHLGERRLSASWIGMNTSILHALFNRRVVSSAEPLAVSSAEPLAGQSHTPYLRGPRRGRRLPRWLSRDDMHALLAHAPTMRDRLLLSLLYGCGLKVGEATRLQWKHLSPDAGALTVPAPPFRCVPGRPSSTPEPRVIPVPQRLQALLCEERSWHTEAAFLFPGRRQGTHLSIRAADRIVRQCVRRARLVPTICAMHLRHAFAIHALEDGANPRALQCILGHRSIETTLIYQRCLLPANASSPLDQIPAEVLHPNTPPTPATDSTGDNPDPEPLPKTHRTLDLPPHPVSNLLNALRRLARPPWHDPRGAQAPPT